MTFTLHVFALPKNPALSNFMRPTWLQLRVRAPSLRQAYGRIEHWALTQRISICRESSAVGNTAPVAGMSLL